MDKYRSKHSLELRRASCDVPSADSSEDNEGVTTSIDQKEIINQCRVDSEFTDVELTRWVLHRDYIVYIPRDVRNFSRRSCEHCVCSQFAPLVVRLSLVT